MHHFDTETRVVPHFFLKVSFANTVVIGVWGGDHCIVIDSVTTLGTQLASTKCTADNAD
jgi:hypothetical protein